MDLKLRRKLKGKQEKNNGCCQVVDLHLYRKKKDGVRKKLCIWIIRDILGERLKKRWGCLNCGFEIGKKWKGKREKKDGCCWVVYLKCKRFAKKKRKKKDGVSQVVDLNLTKNIKGKQKKKMGVGPNSVFE